MPLILPGNVGSATAATGYDVANSVRFNRGDAAYMHKTPGSAGNVDVWTFSAWIKISDEGTARNIFAQKGGDGTSQRAYILLGSGNTLSVSQYTGSALDFSLVANRLFRDQGAWYHIIIAVDTGQGTDTNRIKMYVNGVQETSFSTATYPSQNLDTYVNAADQPMAVGYDPKVSSRHFGGYMAEVVLIDGTQYANTDFGEFDEDSGIWKPIDVSGLTFGTNGFYLDFEASANLGNDANGGTDLTEVNLAAVDQATDTCTNNFATMNPLDNFYAAHPFAEGNTKVSTSTSTTSFSTATIGLSTGKWYFEGTVRAVMGEEGIGVSPLVSTAADDYPGKATDSVSYKGNNGNVRKSNSNAAYGNAYVNNNVIGVLLNLDDNEIKFSLNGTVQNSGTAVALTAAASTPNGVYFPMVGDGSTDSVGVWEVNFGAGSFTALSSAVADGNGFGAFEYAPPSGFLAICTKNLAESG